ncbi:hypothetical protein ACOMHN_026383 [Nucella lapillus]
MNRRQTTGLLRGLVVMLLVESVAGDSFRGFTDGSACFSLSNQKKNAGDAKSKCKNGALLAWFDSLGQMQGLAQVLTDMSIVGVTEQSGPACAVLHPGQRLLQQQGCSHKAHFLCRRDAPANGCDPDSAPSGHTELGTLPLAPVMSWALCRDPM